MPSLVEPAVPAGRLRGIEQPVLHGDGITLRPWEITDAAAVVAAYADPDIERWHVRSMTTAEAQDWIEAGKLVWQDERAASWAIETTGAVAGRMTLKLHLSRGHAEAAYWTVPAARGRGLASRALLMATGWAFAFGVHRVELEHSIHNLASCRVAVRAGFAVEGTRRGAGLHADGWHDMHLHGRVNPVADR